MLTDEHLAVRAQQGDLFAADVLVRRYEPLTRHVARDYYNPSADQDDIRQEARIGVLNAIRNYEPSASSFRSFAFLCVKRHLITCVITANRGKHQALTQAVRRALNEDGEPVDVVDLVEARHTDAAQTAAAREEIRRLASALRVALTPLELQCVLDFANGTTYERISAVRGLDSKSIDNALQRARTKLDTYSLAGTRARPDVYRCPTCGGDTVRKVKRGPGRPPRCQVCQYRAAA